MSHDEMVAERTAQGTWWLPSHDFCNAPFMCPLEYENGDPWVVSWLKTVMIMKVECVRGDA